MHSLWTKLMGAFVLVILVGIGMVVFLISQTTATQFELYITQTGQQQAVQIAPVAANYYTRSGSWIGIDAVLRNPWGYRMNSSGMSNGMMDGDMMGDMGGWSGYDMNEPDMMNDMGMIFSDRIILAEADGIVVVKLYESLPNHQLHLYLGKILDYRQCEYVIRLASRQLQIARLRPEDFYS